MNEVTPHPLSVSLLSHSDLAGGAARAAFRLHQSLVREGIDSRMVVRKKSSDLSTVTSIDSQRSPVRRQIERIRDLWRRRSLVPYRLRRRLEVFSSPTYGFQAVAAQCEGCDLINLHWVTDLIDLPDFFQCVPKSTPVVWTLHDMNAFTGGCHYASDCDRWRERCGVCPSLGSFKERDPSRSGFETRREMLSRLGSNQLTIVTPSRWLERCVRASPLVSRFRCEHIPYGIDTDTYYPTDTMQKRDSLGLKENDVAILFAADRADIPRKGFDLLLNALGRITRAADVVLLVMGEQRDTAIPHGLRTIPLGLLKNDSDICETFSAADVFVIPSREDNLPNVVLESLACGTPVVGFATGGIPDMVRDGVTGLLAEPESVASLANKIDLIVSRKDLRQKMSETCREVAVSDYRMELQASAYISLFQDLCSNRDLNDA